ncbi:MAG: ABC transporter permease [Actinobacteria bacterium]|nr:ABC transporter permease [Actinomycetota bacterium]
MDWSSIVGIGLFASGLQLAMPTALAAVGETVSERAGVLNLGLEGMMLTAALASFVGAYYSGSATLGVLAGVVTGMAMGALMAVLSVLLKTDQVINGIVLVIFAGGVTAFAYERLFRHLGVPPEIDALPKLAIPGLFDIPWVGPVVFNQNALFYFSAGLALCAWPLLFRTRFGLAVRAAGETPAAADAAAVHVDRIRTVALLVCGAMAGLGGAVLIVGDVNLFGTYITAGRGWVALALVIFGRWNPLVVFGGALAFGIVDALQLRIQAASGGTSAAVPYEVFQALPYVLTLVVMVTATAAMRRSAQPSALGIPFRKGVSE